MEDLIIREFKTKDFRDIAAAGYPFSTKMWGTLPKELMSKTLDILQRLKTKRLVAYSRNDRKAVGIITLKKINNNLWGAWGIFVSPAYRGRGISPLLYQGSFDYLVKKGVRKTIGAVEVTNIPSIRGIEKKWDSFLPQRFYEYRGKLRQTRKQNARRIRFRSSRPDDRDAIYGLFEACARKEWYSFLEIDEDDFLDRFLEYFGYRGLLKYLFERKILIAEGRDATVKGYAVFSELRLSIFKTDTATLQFFISPQLAPEEAIALVGELLNTLFFLGFRNVHMISINKNEELLSEISNYLSANLSFKTSKSLVPIRKLKPNCNLERNRTLETSIKPFIKEA